MTSKLRCYYRDSYVIRLYRDGDNLRPPTGTGKKLANPDTDGNSLYHRAVMVNENILCTLDRLKTLTITEKAKSFKETTPAYIPGL